MSPIDRYGPDVLASDWRAPKRGRSTNLTLEVDLVVEEVMTGFCGAVLRWDRDLATVDLEDRKGKRRTFPLGPGFLHEGRPVVLQAPKAKPPPRQTRTASGSVAVPGAKARVARASRIYVEGRHDAELVERVWGDDLRLEGVVVEYLEGVDDLPSVVAELRPDQGGRIGVLVDHLVPGSKETKIAEAVRRGPHGQQVLVVGHPYVDVWQAVKPDRLGLTEWPTIPRSVPWKNGICQALGWPHRDQADIARAWQRILSRVATYADLEPALLGKVEELIDFVTAAEG
ncbi:MAG: DUF3097 family protein [Propionibacteriales bacterium]|nr:DUF3097 family protein [Propionibacteriales bacterium]